MNKKYKLIALDRDGVINEDSDAYIKSPEEWHAIPGSLEAITQLNKAGIIVVITTNQSGIARGHFTEQTLHKMHEKMRQQLALIGGHIDDIYYCPHHPDENCNCRKPKPKMLLDILNKYHVAPKNALVIGDTLKDIEFAANAGCDAILVQTGKGKRTLKQHRALLKDIPCYKNLSAAATATMILLKRCLNNT